MMQEFDLDHLAFGLAQFASRSLLVPLSQFKKFLASLHDPILPRV